MKSATVSPGRSNALIRTNVPGGNRAIVCSALIRGRPTEPSLLESFVVMELLVSHIDEDLDTTYYRIGLSSRRRRLRPCWTTY